MLPKTYREINASSVCMQCKSSKLRIVGNYKEYVQQASFGEDERKHIAAYLNAQSVTFESFVECRSCGLISVSPMPDDAQLNHFYQNYYGSIQYSHKQQKKILRARKRLRKLSHFVNKGEFLDVGCNLGFAVEAARLEGYSATGIEIDANALQWAKDKFPENNFATTTIADFTPEKTFNLVYCSEVIEHVANTTEFVTHLARLTKTGGYLFITTPDAGHWRRPRNFIDWNETKPPEHVNWQTRKSIKLLLMAHGFKAPRFFTKLKPSLHLIAQRE